MPQLKPTRGICLNRSHPLSRGLVGLWLFNEGSGGQVFDLSGNGYYCDLSNVTWGARDFGNGLIFDGTSSYGELSSADLSTYDSNWTILFSVNPTDKALDSRIYTAYNVDQTHSKYGIMIESDDDQWGFFYRNSTLTYKEVDVGINVAFGSRQDVALSYDGTSYRFYLNGILKNTTIDTLDPRDGGKPSVGCLNPASPSGFFKGTINFGLLINRALSASEIALLYREPFCMFDRVWRPGLIGGQIVELAGTAAGTSDVTAVLSSIRGLTASTGGFTAVNGSLGIMGESPPEMERSWLREALFNGMTANAFKLGTSLSLGWFWVRVTGCSVLYRGAGMGEIDFANILAVAEQDACEISPPSYISHNSGSTYFYVVRRFNNCGYQECTLAASVKVSIESNGELAEPQPNKVFDSGAELVAGNKIQLVWYYCPLEQKSQPMCFNVYYDGRTGQINYENPLAIIGYKGRKFYSYQCGALEAGRYLFAIRTEDASGIENSSLARLRIQFDPTNPAAIDILSVEGV